MWRRLPSSYHHPNTALIDPVAIQKPYDIRPNSRSLKTLEAQNAANTATTSSDVSPAARVVAKTLSHPVDLTHIAQGNAEFKDYVRIERY
jgi:hypothetical protein